MQTSEKVVVVMPAYNAGRTLRLTYEELPKDTVSLVILVDDGSTDGTLEVARQLGLEIFVHNRNWFRRSSIRSSVGRPTSCSARD